MTFMKSVGEFFKKFWHLLWKDESVKGWIFAFVFLFVFIQFIFFPGMRLITGSELPLAIVESCSMHHKGNFFSSFQAWWERHDDKYQGYEIDKIEFSNFNFKRGFSKGDIILIIKANPEKLKIGDIIAFDAGPQYANPIIHRIIKIENKSGEYVFSTLGDNNNAQLAVEREITENKLVGKVAFRIVPYLGWGKLIFYDWKQPASERGFCHEN